MSASRFDGRNYDRVIASAERVATHTETIETHGEVINVFADIPRGNGMYKIVVNNFQSKMERQKAMRERLRLALAKKKNNLIKD